MVKKKTSGAKQAGKTGLSKLITPIIAAIIIFATAVVLGLIYTELRSNKLSKINVISSTDLNYITVKDKDTGKEYKVPVNPASGQVQVATPDTKVKPVTGNNQQKITYERLFKPSSSKQDIPNIDFDLAEKIYKSGKALFIDARGDGAFNRAHIKGAICIPPGLAHERIPQNKDKFKNKILVAYCSGAGCHLSDKTAYKLFDAGYKHVVIFFGGWSKWMQHNGPITENKPK